MFDFQAALSWAYAELRTHYPSLHPHCWFTNVSEKSDWGKVTIHLYSDYKKDAVKTAELEWDTRFDDNCVTLLTADYGAMMT